MLKYGPHGPYFFALFYSKYNMNNFASIAIATSILSVFPTISPANEDVIDIGVSLLSFDYAEYLDGQFLDGETGLLPGFYASYAKDIGVQSYIKFAGTYHLGEVDYDGETQGAGIPIQSTSDADIVDTYFVYGRRLNNGAKTAFPFGVYGGLGYRYWRRNINPSLTPSGNTVAGVLEYYDWFYITAGLKGHIATINNMSVNFNIRTTRMMHAEIEIDYLGFQNRDNNSLDLGEKWGLFVGVPIKFKAWDQNITIEPFYRQWDIGRSNIDPITSAGVPTGSGVFEPDSETRNFGVQIYYTLNL